MKVVTATLSGKKHRYPFGDVNEDTYGHHSFDIKDLLRSKLRSSAPSSPTSSWFHESKVTPFESLRHSESRVDTMQHETAQKQCILPCKEMDHSIDTSTIDNKTNTIQKILHELNHKPKSSDDDFVSVFFVADGHGESIDSTSDPDSWKGSFPEQFGVILKGLILEQVENIFVDSFVKGKSS